MRGSRTKPGEGAKPDDLPRPDELSNRDGCSTGGVIGYSLQGGWETMKTATRLLILGLALGGGMIATTGAFAADTLLENAFALVIQKAKHDIVVVDPGKKIIADTIAANVGTVFKEDTGNEVGMTLKDGKPRIFVEKSKDYPQGLQQEVLAVKDKAGTIVGAVVVSLDILK
jgi:hypothetical protein